MNRVIITAGPTLHYIDQVRMISNISSGKTGVELAEILSKKFKTTLLLSKYSKYQTNKKEIKKILFDDFDSLNTILKNELSRYNYDFIIHLAAVSDYRPHLLITETGKKIKLPAKIKISINKPFMIKFKKNFKIINKIKEYSKNKKIKIIGFKLTTSASHKKILQSIKKIPADLIIHNDISKITEKKHIFNVYYKSRLIKVLNNSKTLGYFLTKLIENWRKK